MPVTKRGRIFHVNAFSTPARTGYFIRVAIISIFHNVIDSYSFIPVIIIITLPYISITIYGRFVFVSEIMAQAFHMSTVRITTEEHSFFVFFRPYLITILIDEPQGLPETHGFATSGWNAAPTTGKIIARVAPMLGLEPRLDLPPADQLILAGAKQAAR